MSSLIFVLAISAAACSSTGEIDRKELRRVVGTHSQVRLDAEFAAEQIHPSSVVRIKYEVENRREHAIAIADLHPIADYDHDSRTITISFGSEIPGAETVKLIRIDPNEKRTFSRGARLNVFQRGASPLLARPRYVRVKLNFLTDVAPIEEILASPAAADQLFPRWIESNEALFTNTIPIHWSRGQSPVSTRAGF
ncbi:MAG TPA: hypothetical protein VMT00_11775 [Thermoanaerobaculia bacterium]|nr:hypothetical protein [Thermoanaerobaculia bacterium]